MSRYDEIIKSLPDRRLAFRSDSLRALGFAEKVTQGLSRHLGAPPSYKRRDGEILQTIRQCKAAPRGDGEHFDFEDVGFPGEALMRRADLYWIFGIRVDLLEQNVDWGILSVCFALRFTFHRGTFEVFVGSQPTGQRIVEDDEATFEEFYENLSDELSYSISAGPSANESVAGPMGFVSNWPNSPA